MDEATAIVDFNAMDRAIIAALFISYGVLALFQLGNLFAGRLVIFALIALVTGVVSLGWPMTGMDGLCIPPPQRHHLQQRGAGVGIPAECVGLCLGRRTGAVRLCSRIEAAGEGVMPIALRSRAPEPVRSIAVPCDAASSGLLEFCPTPA